MSGIGEVEASLVVNTAKWREGWHNASAISDSEMDRIQKRVEHTGKVIGTALGAAFVGAVTGITALTVSAINAADSMNNLSQKIGVSVEKLSTLNLIANQSGSNIDGIGNALARLAKNASSAAQGIGAPKKAFDALGISVLDAQGKMKSTGDLLGEVSGKFAGYADGTNKTALAMALFGKAGKDLIPTLNAIGEGTQDAEKYVKSFGATVSSDIAKQASAFSAKLETIKLAFSGFGNTIASRVLPALNELADRFLDSATKGDRLRKFAEKLGDLLASAIRNIDTIISYVVSFGKIVATIYTTKLILSGTMWIASLEAQRAAMTLTAAQAEAAALSRAKSITRITSAFAIVNAFVIGWEIGKHLREKYRFVADMGAYLVYGVIEGWTKLKYKTQEIFYAIGLLVAKSVDGIRAKIADLLDAFVDFANIDLPMGLRADFTYGNSDKLKEVADAIRGTGKASVDAAADLAELRAAADAADAANDKMLESMLEQNGWDETQRNAKKTAQAIDTVKTAADGAAPAIGNLGGGDVKKGKPEKPDDSKEKALLRLQDLVKGYGVEVDDLTRKLNGESDAQIKFDHKIIEAAQAYEKSGGSANAVARQAFENAVALANKAREMAAPPTGVNPYDPLGLEDVAKRYESTNPFSQMSLDLRMFQDDIEATKEKLSELKPGEDSAGLLFHLHKMEEGAKNVKLQMASGMVNAAQNALRGLQSFTKQGSKEYAELGAAADALAVTQAILGIITQATSGPGIGFVAMAAMALEMAPLLAQLGKSISAVGAASGKQYGSDYVQEHQGTGSVLGDANAKSESIAHAMDITADATSKLVGINRGMLNALQNLTAALGKAGGVLARGASDVDFGDLKINDSFGSALSTIFSGGLQGPLKDPLHLFSGKTKIVDQGIIIMAGAITDLINNISIGAYEELKSSSLFFGTKHKTGIADISGQLGQQFALILSSIVDTVTEAAKAIGIPLDDIQAKIAQFQIEETKISLKDLSAEDQQKAIEAVFSKIFDDLAGSVVPFVEQFQKVGEGLGETLVRVATEVQVMQQAVKYLGLTVNEADPEKFAQLSDGLIGLFGSLDDFISSMQSFTDKFAPEGYKTKIATDALTSAFDQLGLTLPTSRDGLWELVNGIDVSTEAGRKQLATILQLTDYADQYYSSLEKGAKDALEAQEAIVKAQKDYISTVVDLRAELGQNPLGQKILDIARWSQDTTDKLNKLAIAAGMAGAKESDLALVQQVAAQRTEQAIAALYQSSQALVDQLYGTHNAATDASSAVSGFGDAMQQASQKAKDAIDLLLGDLSPYTDRRKLDIALQGQRAGTVTPQQVLEIAQRLFGSGADYRDIFEQVQSIGNHTGGQGGHGGGAGKAMKEVAEKTLSKAERYQLADQLANNIADLSSIQKISFEDIADKQGLNLSDLGKDLGLDNNALQAYLKVLASDNFGFSDLSGLLSKEVDRLIAAITGSPYFGDDIGVAVGAGKSNPPVVTLPPPSAATKPADDGVKKEIAALRADINVLLAPIAANTGRTAEGVGTMAGDVRNATLLNRNGIVRWGIPQ